MNKLQKTLGPLLKGSFLAKVEAVSGSGVKLTAGPNGVKVVERLKVALIKDEKFLKLEEKVSDSLLGDARKILRQPGNAFGAVRLIPKCEAKVGGLNFELGFSEDSGGLDLKVDSLAPEEELFLMLDEHWKAAYSELTVRRRRAWKRLFCNDPWLLRQEQENAASDRPSAKLSFKASDLDLNLTSDILLEDLAVLDNPIAGARGLRSVRMRSHLPQAAAAVLLDAVRERMFLSDSVRLSLSPELCPYHAALLCAHSAPSKDLKQLKEFLGTLIEDAADDLRICPDLESIEQADCLGIPLVVILSESSLEGGIVHLRDRETCWFEQVHIAHLARRLKAAFSDGIIEEEEDTLAKVTRQLVMEGKLDINTKKKSKKKKSS